MAQQDPQPLRCCQVHAVPVLAAVAEEEAGVRAVAQVLHRGVVVEAVPHAGCGHAEPGLRIAAALSGTVAVLLAASLVPAEPEPADLRRAAVRVPLAGHAAGIRGTAQGQAGRAVMVRGAVAVQHAGSPRCADLGLGAGGLDGAGSRRGLLAESVNAGHIAVPVLLALREDALAVLADPLAQAVLVPQADSGLLALPARGIADLGSRAVLVLPAGIDAAPLDADHLLGAVELHLAVQGNHLEQHLDQRQRAGGAEQQVPRALLQQQIAQSEAAGYLGAGVLAGASQGDHRAHGVRGGPDPQPRRLGQLEA